MAYVGNAASRRVAEKSGFVLEGTLRSYLVARGQRHDAWIAGLLPDDPVRGPLGERGRRGAGAPRRADRPDLRR